MLVPLRSLSLFKLRNFHNVARLEASDSLIALLQRVIVAELVDNASSAIVAELVW